MTEEQNINKVVLILTNFKLHLWVLQGRQNLNNLNHNNAVNEYVSCCLSSLDLFIEFCLLHRLPRGVVRSLVIF